MNYFELYELPVQLSIDKNLLKKKYFELSRRFHPDYFIQAETGARQHASDQSAAVNKAFKIFSNQDETIKYVLELKGLLASNEKYNLPPDFLMEMMELNETIDEAAAIPETKEAAIQHVLQWEAALYEPARPIVETYNDATISEPALLTLKDYYFKKKYIERLKAQLHEKL